MDILLVALMVQLCALSTHCMWVKEMENKGAFQGDMILDPDEYEHGWNVSNRGYASIKGGRWPGAVVPYVIQNTVGSRGIEAIKNAIANYHNHTCIRWRPRTNEATYVSFYRGEGCSSPVGYRPGRINYISLATGCWETGVTMHEMGHTLGFYHEQSRPDRDKYVRIIWGHIQSGMEFNFNRKTTQTIDSLGTPYDFRSMMHYGATAFGDGIGRVTIQTINPANQHLIGNNKGFSKIDIKQLNLMYKCSKGPTPSDDCTNLNTKCAKWAEQGQCNGQSQEYMNKKCCLACRAKRAPTAAPVKIPSVETEMPRPSNCDNKHSYCTDWANNGWCAGNFEALMKTDCCKACSDFTI